MVFVDRVVVFSFPQKCYKTHTCTGGQRGREGGERGRRAPLPAKML